MSGLYTLGDGKALGSAPAIRLDYGRALTDALAASGIYPLAEASLSLGGGAKAAFSEGFRHAGSLDVSVELNPITNRYHWSAEVWLLREDDGTGLTTFASGIELAEWIAAAIVRASPAPSAGAEREP